MTLLPASNTLRDTPGRLLLAWSLLFTSLVLFSWRVRIHHADYDWLEYPTALGDKAWYDPAPGRGLGTNDFFEANLRFELGGQAQALFRRLHHPTRRRDSAMRKVAREEGGRFYVYQDARDDGPLKRFYLKTGEDRYIEFGARLYYPTFEQTRTARPAPLTAPDP